MTPLIDENILRIATFIELGLLFAAIIIMIVVKIYFTRSKKILTERQEKLKSILFTELFKNDNSPDKILLPKKLTRWDVLLPALEQISLKLSGDRWEILKFHLVELYLKDLARSWATKRSWHKRNAAGRIYFLAPKKEDKKEIMALLHDRSYLNRSIAAHAAVQTGNPTLIAEVLKVMGSEHPRRRYTYRHAISKGELPAYLVVIDIYRESQDEEVHVACLDIFIYETMTDPHTLISRDIHSPSPNIRCMVARIATKFPSQTSAAILRNYLDDPDGKVRSTAARGMGILHDESSIDKLTEMLNDKNWDVRVQAALSLKSLGEKGINQLKSLDPDLNPLAYDAGRYALTLP